MRYIPDPSSFSLLQFTLIYEPHILCLVIQTGYEVPKSAH